MSQLNVSQHCQHASTPDLSAMILAVLGEAACCRVEIAAIERFIELFGDAPIGFGNEQGSPPVAGSGSANLTFRTSLSEATTGLPPTCAGLFRVPEPQHRRLPELPPRQSTHSCGQALPATASAPFVSECSVATRAIRSDHQRSQAVPIARVVASPMDSAVLPRSRAECLTSTARRSTSAGVVPGVAESPRNAPVRYQ
jgi:hypothetical protein